MAATVSTLVELPRGDVLNAIMSHAKKATTNAGQDARIVGGLKEPKQFEQLEATIVLDKTTVYQILSDLAREKLSLSMREEVKHSAPKLLWTVEGFVDGAEVKFTMNGR